MKLTQVDVGVWVDKSDKTISNYEKSDAEPSIEDIKVFCEKFNVTADNLLFSDLTIYGSSENIGMVSEPNEKYNSKPVENTEGVNEKEKDIVTETEKLRMAIRNMQEDILRLQVDVEKLKKKK